MPDINVNTTGLRRAVLLNDLSCFGKCSITVGLPILSAVGVEALPLPTAVLSTHTGGFTGYTCADMTDQLQCIARHWQTLGLQTDAVATGYFCNAAQLGFARQLLGQFAGEKTLVLVDPVMADGGRLYPGFDPDFVQDMRGLVSMAGVITPNLTEALLLADLPYTPRPTPAQLTQCIQKLHALGARRVVITGVARTETGDWSAFPDQSLPAAAALDDPHRIGCICSDGKTAFSAWHPYVATALHGCGDVFSAALLAAALGAPAGAVPLYGSAADWFIQAVPIAVDFTRRCVQATDTHAWPGHWYGLRFEQCLSEGFWKGATK